MKLRASFLMILLIASGCGRAQFEVIPAVDHKQTPLSPCTDLPGDQCSEDSDSYNLAQRFDVTAPLTKTDILFVIDNSSSMETEQANIGNSFSQFINILENMSGGLLDYRVAIATTDMALPSGAALANPPLMKGGRLVPFKNQPSGTLFLTRNTSNRVVSFNETVQINKDLPASWDCNNPNAPRTNCPSGDERGTYAALAALERNEGNWIRSDASLAVVILSDEDVRSTGGRADPDHPSYSVPALESGKDFPQDVVNMKISKYGASKKMNVHSIIVKPGDQACLDKQGLQTFAAYEGFIYAQLSGMTGGAVGNICQEPFDQQVSTIGQVIQESLNSFQLQCAPENGYVQVEYVGGSRSNVPKLNGTELKFTPALPSGIQFVVRYSCPKTT